MTKFASALLAIVVLLTQAATAADRYGAPSQGVYAPAPRAYPTLLPPCWDSFWQVLLQCAPRGTAAIPYDDLYAQNQIHGVRPATRKPYVQVFTW